MQRSTLMVDGMSCMGCVNSVKNLLRALPGIGQVEVDLGQGRVEVEHDPASTSLEQLRAAIEAGGYQVVG